MAKGRDTAGGRKSATRDKVLANERTSQEFVFKLEGGLHDLSVSELVPTLQSMALAVREANRTLFPQATELRVGVKPISEGSYEIHYVLSYVQEHLPLLAAAATGTPGGVNQIAQLLSDLGVIKRAGTGLLEVIKRLRGKPTKIEQVAPNEYKAESEKGSAVVSGNVKNLLQNSIIIENLNIAFNASARTQGVEQVKTYLAEDPTESAITTTREAASTLDEYVKGLNKPGDEIKENVSTVWVNPHRGPFTGDPGQWWFKRGGGKPFPATIKDKRFLESYGQGEPRLNSEDLLEVELLERQKLSDGKLTTSYTIVKVMAYRPAGRKGRLPFPAHKRATRRRR